MLNQIRFDECELLLRSLLDGFHQDAQLGDEQDGEEYQEEEEGGLYGSRIQFGNGRAGRQDVLDGPRLAAHLCHNPAGLSGGVLPALCQPPLFSLNFIQRYRKGASPILRQHRTNGKIHRIAVVAERTLWITSELLFAKAH